MPRKKKIEEENEPKQVLYKLVEDSKLRNHTIIGALTKAGLIEQYNQELVDSLRLIVPATITRTEFNEIINKYLKE